MSFARLRILPPPEDLPPPDFGMGGSNDPSNRWVPSRKEAVVKAVQAGQITLAQAERDYALSLEEFLAWVSAFDAIGRRGLRAVKGLAEMRPRTRYRPPYSTEPSRENIPPGRHAGISLPRIRFTDGGGRG